VVGELFSKVSMRLEFSEVPKPHAERHNITNTLEAVRKKDLRQHSESFT
jgi:hypothetical protein